MVEMLVDTHTHYCHKRFDSGRNEILQDLKDTNVMVVEAAIEFLSNQKMKSLCEKHTHVFMAAGCHPNCVEEMDDEKYQAIVELTNYDKVLAIGETGLDYARDKSEAQIRLQKEWFRKFLALAIEKQKPLVIHCREAYDEMIDILKEYTLIERPGIIHCFSGNETQAEKLIDMGFCMGVNGMFTKIDKDADIRAVLKKIPLEKIVLETDSPYLIPEGVSGKRNTSKNLSIIVEKFAELREEPTEYIREVVLQNTKRLYPAVFAAGGWTEDFCKLE